MFIGGGVVITHHIQDIFREKVIQLLKNMKMRVFPDLRKKILKIVKEIYENDKSESRPKEINEKICSKHWWFNFIKKNPDIKTLWKKIPLARTAAKNKGCLESEDEDYSSTLSSPNDTYLTSPSSQIKIEIPQRDSCFTMEEETTPGKMNSSSEFKTEEQSNVVSYQERIIKKEEEKIESLSLVSNKIVKQEIIPKREEETFPVQQIKIKEAKPLIEYQIQRPPYLFPHIQPNHLEMLLRQRRMLDMIITQAFYQRNCQITNVYNRFGN